MQLEILLLLAIYTAIVLYLTSWETSRAFNGYSDLTPKYFYNKKQLNWFGAWVAFICLSLFSPLCFIIKFMALLYEFIKWLFIVGRQEADDEKAKEDK